MERGKGFPIPSGILGPQGTPFPGHAGEAQRKASGNELPENMLMKVKVRSPVLVKYTGNDISTFFPVSVQGGPNMLSMSEAYFWSENDKTCIHVFRQLQLCTPDYAILVVKIPKWWNEEELKKAKVIDE